MSLYACCCNHRPPLCDYWVAEALRYLGGAAGARGAKWAQALSRTIPLDRPWPATTDRIRAMARRKVEGLTKDERLFELYTDRAIEGARRRWADVLMKGKWRAG